jgi:hypothetical protein
MTRAVCTVAAAVALMLASALSTDGSTARDGQAKGKGADSAKKYSSIHPPASVFSPRDRLVIGDYFRNISSSLPPGLRVRNGDLPPGLERQLRTNGRLPEGLEKHIDPFPRELNGRLVPLPREYTRGLIGGTAVVIDQRTMTILDIIPNLFDAARR